MNDLEQWELYGMFAALLEIDGFAYEAKCIRIEAEGEELTDQTEAGEAELNVWLRLYVKRGITRKYRKLAACQYANPLTLH